MMKPFGLGYQKVNICLNLCMFDYNEEVNLMNAKPVSMLIINPLQIDEGQLPYAKKLRYFLIISKLQRLFMFLKTSEHMTRYYLYDANDGVMVHYFNGESLKVA